MKRRAVLARIAAGSVAAGGVALAISGLVVRPPVLMRAQVPPFGKTQEPAPGDAQRVELELDGRTTLRGWYVPADAGAPLVLHLLESTASVDSPYGSRWLAARQLADLGFASLFLDYAGVGASDGERSAEHLGRDARAMWDEALRRVDGDSGRVVLRCTSIGTLAALPLLHGGARPAGVILLLPVLPDTLAQRFARSFYGRAASWFARAAFRRVVDQDLFEVVRATPTAWLAVQAERDQMTSVEERAAIDAAVAAAGGRAARLEEDHLVAALVLRTLCDAEVSFLTAVVPGVRDVEARWGRFTEVLPEELREGVLFDATRVAGLRRLSGWSYTGDWRALLAIADSFDDERLATRLRWWLEEPRYRKLDHEKLRCVGDLDDPAGPIPLAVLFTASRIESLSSRTFTFRMMLDPTQIERLARESVAGLGEACSRTWATFAGVESGVELHPGKLLGQLREHGLSDADARRQLARVLLKTHAIPDRLLRAPDGTLQLEYFERDAWRPIQPDPDAPSMAAEDTAIELMKFTLEASNRDR